MADVDVLANQLFVALTADANFEIPEFDFDGPEFQPPPLGEAGQPITPPSNGDLTEGTIDGNGTFDEMMKGIKAQLEGEFKANRITGAEYTKAYIALTQSALAASVQYLLGRDQSYWASITAQLNSITARVGLETAKAQAALVASQIYESEAQYALTKAKLASEEAAYDQVVFQTTQVGPQQLASAKEQVEVARAQTLETRTDGSPIEGLVGLQKEVARTQAQLTEEQIEQTRAQTSDTRTDGTPITGLTGAQIQASKKQAELIDEQIETAHAQISDTRIDGVTPITGLAGSQIKVSQEQVKLVKEQTESARAQTLDTRSDLAVVTGSVGKQKELYDEQITSYKRDAETKLAKIFSDAWITQKTLDEGLVPPASFTNAEIDEVLNTLRGNLDLGTSAVE